MRVDGTKQVDAFILVLKADPWPQTLESDIERIRDLFGTKALKSLILLVISCEDVNQDEGLIQKLKKDEDIPYDKRFKTRPDKGQNCYCLWNNLNPRKEQEEELLRKISYLEPYTYNDFQGSQKKRLKKELKFN